MTGFAGVLAFWSGMLLAAWHFPSEYDWRYMTLSSLLSPRSNPSGHLWASAGIVLCGICGWYWAATLARGSDSARAGQRPSGIWALRLGSVCMAFAAVLPHWLLPLPKGHEMLALLAFVGLCLGVVRLTYWSIKRNFLRRTNQPSGHYRVYATVLAGGAVVPILLAGCAQAYVYYALPKLRWVSLSWRDHGIPVYFSFAFWEWITCVVLSAYMATLSRWNAKGPRHVGAGAKDAEEFVICDL